VDGERIGLLGHSMGTAAVVRYATAHPAIRATVSVSQGLMSVGSASRPRDLLLLAGGLEFPGYRESAAGTPRLHFGFDVAIISPQGRIKRILGDSQCDRTAHY
jgi:pimeloyl-ACP methyl ester carboxylesterase